MRIQGQGGPDGTRRKFTGTRSHNASPDNHPMAQLLLAPIQACDLEAVTEFEVSNRRFFERHVNARGDDYYAAGGIQRAIDHALADAAADRAFQFLGRSANGTLVVRVNLSRVRRRHFMSAELGYRVGEVFQRQGYATQAVQGALQFAFGELRLRRVEATASPANQASCRVLERTRFREFGRSTRSFQLAGRWHDLLHYEIHAPDAD